MIKPLQACRRPRGWASQRGYALLLVLGSLAAIAVVAGRFASRVDLLRGQARTMQAYADASVAAAGALAVGQYWVATREAGPLGFGSGAELLRADGTTYTLSNAATVQVQDQRGLIALNTVDLAPLRSLLQLQGVAPPKADAMIDGLLDYTDTDGLHRLNGAEAPAYEALGRPPPRNDWLLSTHELSQVCFGEFR